MFPCQPLVLRQYSRKLWFGRSESSARSLGLSLAKVGCTTFARQLSSSSLDLSALCGSEIAGRRQSLPCSRELGDSLFPPDRNCFVERPLARPAQAAGRFLIAASGPDEDPDEDPEQGPGSVPDAFSGAQEETQPSEGEHQGEEYAENSESAAEDDEEEEDEDEAAALAGPLQFTDEELR